MISRCIWCRVYASMHHHTHLQFLKYIRHTRNWKLNSPVTFSTNCMLEIRRTLVPGFRLPRLLHFTLSTNFPSFPFDAGEMNFSICCRNKQVGTRGTMRVRISYLIFILIEQNLIRNAYNNAMQLETAKVRRSSANSIYPSAVIKL